MHRIINTASNIGYSIIGLYATIEWGFSPFALACLILGLGSAAFHYFFDHPDPDYRYWAHHADELGMYMVFSSVLGMLFGTESWLFALPAWLSLHFVALKFSATETLGVMGIMIATLMIKAEMFIQLGMALALLAFAYYVRHGDEARYKRDYRMGHAMWHAVTTIMIAVLVYFIKL